MKKKLITLLLTSALTLSGCGGADTPAANTPSETGTPAVETPGDNVSEEDSEDLSELDSLGDVEVEQQLFDVTVTIPANYIESSSQEELDAAAKEYGYKATLNEDGSATYVMTKSQHKEMMEELTSSMQESLNSMAESEEYPNITSVTANSDFTEFTVTTKNSEPDLAESFSVMAFYMYGGMYNIFNGTEVDNIHVDFVNADSGEIISSSDSKNLEDSEQ